MLNNQLVNLTPGFGIPLVFFLFYEYNYGRQVDNRDEIKKLILALVKARPVIGTEFEVKNNAFREDQKKILSTSVLKIGRTFEFNHWIDATDLGDVETKINSSGALLIKYEVEFADAETRESYSAHVENSARQIIENPDDGDENERKEIVNRMILKIGDSVKKENLGTDLYQFIRPPLNYRLHWSLKILELIVGNQQKIEEATIKKIISQQCTDIL